MINRYILVACIQSAMDEELELTTDGSDIYVSRKTEPLVICALSLTSAAIRADGMRAVKIALFVFIYLFCLTWNSLPPAVLA